MMSDLNERSLGQVFLQMLSAINHVHMAEVLHRDVKMENFLVGGEDGATIKLSDFGLSVILRNGSKKRGMRGTIPYMSPEMVKNQWYNTKTDMWSFGVTAYVLLYGCFPYTTMDMSSHGVMKAIERGSSPEFDIDGQTGIHSDCVTAFVKALLQRDPDVRLSASNALSMPYMNMIENNCYMPGVELLPLHSVLSRARRVGACGDRDVSDILSVDSWLNMLQMELHGEALPEFKKLQMELRGDTLCDNQPNHELSFPDFVVSQSGGYSDRLADNSTSYDSSTIDLPSPTCSGSTSASVLARSLSKYKMSL
jgi:serine/threonine protein kinase